MGKKYKSADDFSRDDNEKEMDTLMDIYNIDEYDRSLQDIKRLANERKLVPPQYRRAYDLAIERTVEQIIDDFHDDVPYKIMTRDIDMAKEGGKIRELYTQAPQVNYYRKNKSTKTKPKRKIVKKPVKKVVRKSKPKKK